MSTDAIPHINTNDSPMPTARDDSWRIMARHHAGAIVPCGGIVNGDADE